MPDHLRLGVCASVLRCNHTQVCSKGGERVKATTRSVQLRGPLGAHTAQPTRAGQQKGSGESCPDGASDDIPVGMEGEKCCRDHLETRASALGVRVVSKLNPTEIGQLPWIFASVAGFEAATHALKGSSDQFHTTTCTASLLHARHCRIKEIRTRLRSGCPEGAQNLIKQQNLFASVLANFYRAMLTHTLRSTTTKSKGSSRWAPSWLSTGLAAGGQSQQVFL